MATQPTQTGIFTLPYTDEVLRNFSGSTVNATDARENLNALMTALILQSVIIIVVFGNALVLAALASYRSWTSADILLFSLSLADFLDSALAVELITVVRYFLGQQMAKPMCDAFVTLVYTFRMASSFTVTCIAVERSLLLKFPLRHHTLVTPARIKKFVAAIWLFSIFSAFLPLIGAGNSGFKNGVCFSQLYDLGKAYAIYIETYGAIMFLTVFASYFTIKVSGIKFIRRQTLMRGHGGARSQSSVYSCRGSVHSPGKTSGVRSVRKLAVMMGIVVIIYYISWLPFLLNNLFCLIIDQQPSPKIVLLTTLFSFLHALANPLLYGWMSQRYRRGYIFVFKMVLSACGGHRPDRRTLGMSCRFSTGPNLTRQPSATDITVYNSRPSLQLVDHHPATTNGEKEDHSLNNNVVPSEPGKNKEKGDIPRNNNEEPCSHGNQEATTVEVENNVGVNNASLVSAEVIQLLDALLNRIEMKTNAQVEFAEL
ncbi:unnamed protein product [Porites lobata]|uniref:Thyrotropin-releasing hormone receptor n=1 Tax=Porites lobata TaxID=104759 RepID=A0ABN8P3A7_9CNID|nr:unnamed protein product [Porites lobata]